jgi:16S rRNA (adenine1518-N6/adenine1519-N6)-dimethyltransferase
MNFPDGPIRAKKQLGQHFLADQNIARNTVALLQPTPTERILEIGPGMGVLTQLLSSNLPNLITGIDADAEAIAYLQHLALPRVELLHGDVLSTPWPEGELALIGNLPYNISSPIFFELLAHRMQIRRAVVMIQLEVAQRIAEPPGSKTYGPLIASRGAHKYAISLTKGLR